MKILFTDVERFPHDCWSWDIWQTNIPIGFIKHSGGLLCWASKWYKKKQVTFRSLWDDAETYVSDAHKLMSEADAIVHYNGKAYDIKAYNVEFARLGLVPPAPSKQIDLYRVVKQNFMLPSYSLAYVLRYFGLPQKLDTGGVELWVKAMAGDQKARNKMRRYNINDTKVLEPLYEKLRPWIKQHPNVNLYKAADGTPHCATCGSTHLVSNGYRRTAVAAYRRLQCQDCGAWNHELKNKPELRVGG